MAFNIDLNKKIKKASEIESSVDSRIVLNKDKTDNYLYSDLKLDLNINGLKEKALNASVNFNDIELILDEESIINSLKNMINTSTYSRLLNPNINFDLKSYLFEPVSEEIAFLIAYDIYNFIPVYEPRISIDYVNIIADIYNSQYNITMSASIPSLNKSIDVVSILNDNGFSLV